MGARGRSIVTFDDVRGIALSFEGVEEGSSYGTPGFRVRGTLFARFHQDGESLVVRTTTEARDDLMASEPDIYYVTDHYVPYEWVLVRVARAHSDALRDLLMTAWRLAGGGKPPAPRRRPSPRVRPVRAPRTKRA